MKLEITLQTETTAALEKLAVMAPGTVALAEMKLGVKHGEPLLVALDGMVRYAKAYAKRNGAPMDAFLGKYFAQAIAGLRGLCNGDGAVAMEREISTDSKDNGTLESLYWTACAAAGMDGDNLPE